MNFYLLKAFHASSIGICGDDLNKEEEEYLINLDHISLVSPLRPFEMPLTGRRINSKFVMVSVSTGLCFYIRENEYLKLRTNIVKDELG